MDIERVSTHMRLCVCLAGMRAAYRGVLLAVLVVLISGTLAAGQAGAADSKTAGTQGPWGRNTGQPELDCEPSVLDSPYIPVDSWVYPAVLRLYSLGYVDSIYLGMRPWTRSSLEHALEETGARIEDEEGDTSPALDEAQGIYDSLMYLLRNDMQGPCLIHQGGARLESAYTVARAISGTPLRDSFHLGSTVVNDYGRPYSNGFNNYSGASGYASAGRFLIYARGEFQAAPSATGYSSALAETLSNVDLITFINPATNLPYNQATIPLGPIGATVDGRVMEAYVSAHYLNHEISFGKQDDWLGPGQGGGMAYSNNAENIYSFRINRVEPLQIPLLSRITGPFRYEFLVGGLHGHTYVPNPAYVANPEPDIPNVINPGDPWVHVEKVSFKPTPDLEFGFERTVIWGGKGHEPITVKSFVRSFISLSAPMCAGPTATNPHPPCAKYDNTDPGARFGAFDFTYRLPFLRNWLTLYADSEAHDDVSPIDAPRRASYRPGLYLSHVPGIPKLDVRVEGVSTDPPTSRSIDGAFMYYEGIQKQGYTNKGQLFGDWIGREDKGGQGWVTYHLSGNEWFQVGVRNQKAAKDFVPGGTTLNAINFQVVKRIGKDFEINGNFDFERYKAPIYLSGQQTVTTTTIHLTWFPERKISF